MSNFICPTCGFNNIDCGRDGYKTDREIELEKKLSVTSKNLAFAKLSLRYIIDCCKDSDVNNLEFYIKRICKKAEQALEKIKE